MSFKGFKEELLVGLAVVSNAKPTFSEEAFEVAKKRKLEFRDGWLRQAVKSLDQDGFIRATYFLAGGENLGMPVSITGDGLQLAEEIANSNGFDLYEEISEFNAATSAQGKTIETLVPASDRIVRIDHNSTQYKSVVRDIEQVKQYALKSNSLREEFGEVLDQKLAEIEAGERLIQAPQANADMVRSLLVNSLKWLGEKIADHAIGVLVAAVLATVVGWLV
jgi:hypothetical protein